jgi:hypothetical protein
MVKGLDKGHATPLTWPERVVAGLSGLAMIGVAYYLVVAPPGRLVALNQCSNAAAGCVVRVDSDLTAFAAVLAGIGAAAALIALLGVRFNRVKLLGTTELAFDQQTEGLAHAEPTITSEEDEDTEGSQDGGDDSLKIEVRTGLGQRNRTAPIAITRLSRPLSAIDPDTLRDYQSARKVSQHGYFMTHILGPATHPNQKFSVAIRVTPHKTPTVEVKSATFFLGRAWGNRAISGRPGPDGRFGMITEAYGPFLALCAVEFTDGSRILLDHYCDFDMGSLLATN